MRLSNFSRAMRLEGREARAPILPCDGRTPAPPESSIRAAPDRGGGHRDTVTKVGGRVPPSCPKYTLGGNSPVVQWLGLSAFTAKGAGSLPGRELRSRKPCGVAIKRNKKQTPKYTLGPPHTQAFKENEGIRE